jgi:hypothetical protein
MALQRHAQTASIPAEAGTTNASLAKPGESTQAAVMVAQGNNLPVQRSFHQFNLRTMLLFVLACGMYMAVLVSVAPVFRPYGYDRGVSTFLSIVLTVPTAWVVFWLLYRKWGLRHGLIVHCSGPVLTISVFLLIAGVATISWSVEALLTLVDSMRDRMLHNGGALVEESRLIELVVLIIFEILVIFVFVLANESVLRRLGRLWRRWGHVLVRHWLPLLMASLTLLVISLAALLEWSSPHALARPGLLPGLLAGLGFAILFGCWLGTLVSFPITLLMLLHLAGKSRRQPAVCGGPRHPSD